MARTILSGIAHRLAPRMLAAILLAPAAAIAGDLTPPAPPGPTMLSLDEVEPRTPIGALTTPGDATATFVIGAPGSYFLTGDVVGSPGLDGLRIDADDVTIDLGGFAIRGGGVGATGVLVADESPDDAFDAIVIGNGRISDWAELAIDATGEATRLSDLLIENTGAGGVFLGNHALVERCTALDTGASVFRGAAFVVPSPGRNARFVDCVADTSTGAGFWPGSDAILERCIARNCDVGFDAFAGRPTFIDCRASENIRIGFSAVNGEGAVLDRCVSRDNTGVGFSLGDSAVVRDCISIRDDWGFQSTGGAIFENCLVEDAMVGNGFIAGDGSIFRGCRVDVAAQAGIRAGWGSTFVDCTVSGAGSRAMWAEGDATFSNCTAMDSNDGFVGGSRSSFDGCSAVLNTGVGFIVGAGSSIRECRAESNNDGIVMNDGCLVESTIVRSNAVYGIHAEDTTAGENDGQGRIDGCIIDGNGYIGVFVEEQTLITDCQVSLNGEAGGVQNGGVVVGFEATRIDGCSFTQNAGRGIRLLDNRNIVVRCNFYQNQAHIDDVLGTSKVAPLVGDPALMGPWDNFAH